MRQILFKLFGRRRTNDQQAPIAKSPILASLVDYDPNSLHDRLAVALLGLLGKQLEYLGYEYEKVPAELLFISKNCRGYLLGLAHGVAKCECDTSPKADLEGNIITAFVLVFGREAGFALARETSDEFGPGSGLAKGYMLAWNEVEAIYQSDSEVFASGFHFLATQENTR